jgi:hypothetical protein
MRRFIWWMRPLTGLSAKLAARAREGANYCQRRLRYVEMRNHTWYEPRETRLTKDFTVASPDPQILRPRPSPFQRQTRLSRQAHPRPPDLARPASTTAFARKPGAQAPLRLRTSLAQRPGEHHASRKNNRSGQEAAGAVGWNLRTRQSGAMEAQKDRQTRVFGC